MGLIDSTQGISQEMQVVAEIQTEKETNSQINARLERKLEIEFSKTFKEIGSRAVYDYYNVDTREKIIQDLGKNDYEFVRLNKIYDKVLRRIFKIFKNDEKYKDWYANGRKNKK